jgi:limonene-1,2-epoxide hydrolase
MNQAQRELVTRWFEGLNTEDTAALLSLFGPTPRIFNAAQPVREGPTAARELLNDFFGRTSAREFKVIDMAATGRHIFAAWEGTLEFRAGVRIADVTLSKPLTHHLRGAERFSVDTEGRIQELHICHETTSLPVAARAAEGVGKEIQR